MLFVIGAKLGLIHHYGTDQPFADQWAAEGAAFLQAPLNEKLNWASFFWLHGEHRPAITRFITRGLINANNGQWDCYVEIVFNLLIYATFLLVAWRVALKLARGIWLGVVAVFMAVLFSQPCAYENLLWGFQSQFLFLLLSGLIHVVGTLQSPRPDWKWWGAQLIGFCGLFSIAAGIASPATLVVVAVIEIFRDRRDAWTWMTLVINTVLLAYGLWLLPAGVTSSGLPLVDHLAKAFLHTGYLLSWPVGGVWWCLLLQAPCVMGLTFWLKGNSDRKPEHVVALIGTWIALAAFAVGYGRTLTPETIGVRYFDVMIVGIFANFLSLVGILTRPRNRGIWPWSAFAVIWLIAVAVGYWSFNKPGYSGAMLRQQKVYAEEQRQIIREFFVTGDPSALEEFSNRTHRLPHYQITLALLEDRDVRPWLPPTLSVDGRVGPLSSLAPKLSSLWGFFMGGGALLLLTGVFRRERNAEADPTARQV